jgi:hypothetical protein
VANAFQIAGLLSEHFPESAISAILANIDVETGGTFDHTTEQRGGKGYGLFQFDDQQEAYWDWLESTTLRDSPESQIQFVADAIYNDDYNAEGMFTGPLDIGGESRKAIRKAFNEGSAAEIAEVFSKEYERPSKPNMKKRIESAEDFEMFKGLLTNPL